MIAVFIHHLKTSYAIAPDIAPSRNLNPANVPKNVTFLSIVISLSHTSVLADRFRMEVTQTQGICD